MNQAHDTPEVDPYQWLEDVTGPAALDWVRDRNAKTLGELSHSARFTGSAHRDPPGARRRRPHPLPAAARCLPVQLLAGRGPPPGPVAAHDAGGVPPGPAGLGSPAGRRRAGRAGGRELGLAGRDRAAARRVPAGPGGAVPGRRGRERGPRVRRRRAPFRRGRDSASPRPRPTSGGSTPDRIYVGTDFGPGSLTSSGYPRMVKQWRRGTALSEATVVYEGKPDDVSVHAFHDPTEGFERDFVVRSIDFFRSEWYLRTTAATGPARGARGRHRRRAPRVAAGPHPVGLGHRRHQLPGRGAAGRPVRRLPGRRAGADRAVRAGRAYLAELLRLDPPSPDPQHAARRAQPAGGAHPRPRPVAAHRAGRGAGVRPDRHRGHRSRRQRRVPAGLQRVHPAGHAALRAHRRRPERAQAGAGVLRRRGDVGADSSSPPPRTAPRCPTSWSGRARPPPGPPC